jgi:hypothetical protein
MPQSLTLAIPIAPAVPPATQTYTVARMLFERLPFARVLVGLVDNNGARLDVEYRDDAGGTVAAQMLSALNTANLTTKSLQQRVLERLIADGKLPAGAVTGIPD